jgi:hypothetical protein
MCVSTNHVKTFPCNSLPTRWPINNSMRQDEHVPDVAAPSYAERRRSPRVEVVEAIQGQIRPHDVPITLVNVSHGGFLMRSPVAYAVGGVHKFRITVDSEYPIVLRGRVAHQRRITTNATPAYLIGVEFTDQQITACAQAIDVLVTSARRR